MFKGRYVQGKTLEDTWFQLLFAAEEDGRKTHVDSGSFAGHDRLEFDFAAGEVLHAHQRPLAPRLPEGVPAPTTDDGIEAYFAGYLMDPVLNDGEEYRYSVWINGEMLNPHLGNVWETALDWIIRHFREAGYGNNHCFMRIGQPEILFNYDKPYATETERGTTPCLTGLDFKIKDGFLLTGVYYRSWDLYSGWPENMGGFTLLNEYVAEQLPGVESGPLFFASCGLHCYDIQAEAVRRALHR